MPDESPKSDTEDVDLKGAVADLVSSLKAAPDAIRKANAEATPPATPTPVTPAIEPITEESLNKLADEKGVGAVIKVVGDQVLGPMHGHNLKIAKDLQRKTIEQDSDIGQWAKDNRKAIAQHIKDNGITDQKLAEEGYEKVVGDMRLADPKVRDADVEARAKVLMDAKLKEMQEAGDIPKADSTNTPVSAATAAAYPVDRPGVSPIAGPPAPKSATEEQAIASVKLTDEELEFGRRYFHMSPDDMRKQRYERQQLEQQYGEMGIKALGGYPVCSLESLGIPDPDKGGR